MVYSTCTFAPEENEGTILSFLQEHEDFYLEERECPEGLMHAVPKWAFYGHEKTEETEEIFEKKGIRLYVYTVNDRNQARKYIAQGAEGICTDFLTADDLW